jgi:hypothetical protein
MHSFFDSIRDKLRKNIERERRLDHPLETISLVIWPYPESKLVFYVSLLAFLDYTSTFVALRLSGNSQIYEAGLLAKWALQTGGFSKLFLVDVVCIGTLICMAYIVRSIYSKMGFIGFSRAAFIFLLIPYFVFIMGVVVNNILVTFL